MIVRPHPQSFRSETEMIERIMKAYPDSDQLEWNRDNDNYEVLKRSDILDLRFLRCYLRFHTDLRQAGDLCGHEVAYEPL